MSGWFLGTPIRDTGPPPTRAINPFRARFPGPALPVVTLVPVPWLAIAGLFVRCADGDVTGRLHPYEDPETGERIFTTFEGTLHGSRFEGRFASLYQPSGMRASGVWTVTLKPAKPPNL